MPPAQYDYPFPGRVTEYYFPYWELDKECRGKGGVPPGLKNWRIEACSWKYPDPRDPSKVAATVFYPTAESVGQDILNELKRHEQGHMNDPSGDRSHKGWGYSRASENELLRLLEQNRSRLGRNALAP